jgi:GntR family transcriptional regulator
MSVGRDATEPREGRPLYQGLAEDLARAIGSGDLRPGAQLPPERRLAEEHGVSRVTVRRAIEQLAREGLVEQKRGSGTYVSRRVSQPLSILTSFSEDVAARGMYAQSELVGRGVGVATPDEVISLGLAPGHRVSRIVRLRSADGQPLALESSTLVHDALPDPEAVGDSLYETLDRKGLRPVRAVQRLSAVPLDPALAQMLGTSPGAPGLLIVRIGYSADGRAVEYTRSTFRGDRWDFVTELS